MQRRTLQPRWRRTLRHPLVIIVMIAAWLALLRATPTSTGMDGFTIPKDASAAWSGYVDDSLRQATLADTCIMVPQEGKDHRVVRYEDLNSWEDQQKYLVDGPKGSWIVYFEYSVRHSGFITPLIRTSRWSFNQELLREDLFTPEELALSPMPGERGAKYGYRAYLADASGLKRPDIARDLFTRSEPRVSVVWWGWLWLATLAVLPVAIIRGMLDLPRFFEDFAAARRAKTAGLCPCGYARIGLEPDAVCPECGAPGEPAADRPE